MSDVALQIAALTALLVVPVVAARAWGGSLSIWPALAGGAAAVLVCGFLLVFALHACGAGQPLRQILVAGLSVGVAVGWLRRPAARWILSAAMLVVGATAAMHWSDLVHGPYFTGNPEWVARATPSARAESRWYSPITGLYAVQAPREVAPAPSTACPDR